MMYTAGFTEDQRQQAKRLAAYCAGFRSASSHSAITQLLTTAIPFVALVAAMFWIAPQSYWAALALAVPAGAFLVRFFGLQHDCGHGSLFPVRRANEWVGRAISILTFTPYDHWRRSHALHHQLSGNLDRRGFGDIATMTVNEYRTAGFWQRLGYRLYRNPLIVLVLGPPLFFLILQRFALGSNMPLRHSLLGIVEHNMVLMVFYGTLVFLLGWALCLMVLLPLFLVAAWSGGWLFYVQHQFEETLWDGADEWDHKIAALKGSSYLKLPKLLNWFSCDIGLHHIHHLCSGIPNYRLRECLGGNGELATVSPTLTFAEALRTARLALWDEATRRLISFREYARLPVAATA